MLKVCFKNRIAVLAVAIVLLMALSAATVYAYLRMDLGSVENSFEAADDPSIQVKEESFDGETKTNVAVDAGDPGYAVYVRAAVVVTWQKDSNVLALTPVAGTDYSVVFNSDDWFGKDGFYYYKLPMSSGTTNPLIRSLTQLKDAPVDGYTLNVEIISQTIQALGTTDVSDVPAVTDAWGVTVDSNGNLQP